MTSSDIEDLREEYEKDHSDTGLVFLEQTKMCVTCGTRIITKYRQSANYCHCCYLDRDFS